MDSGKKITGVALLSDNQSFNSVTDAVEVYSKQFILKADRGKKSVYSTTNFVVLL